MTQSSPVGESLSLTSPVIEEEPIHGVFNPFEWQCVMWIFTYGSLMWDGWEINYAARRFRASLEGYRRVFNKPSVKRWGSNKHPGPTLNLEAAVGMRCDGIAFAIGGAHLDAARAYLRKREGPDFPLRSHQIQLADGACVTAEVPIYAGQVLFNKSIDDTVALVHEAVGTAGSCEDYVRNIAAALADLNIDDSAVTTLIDALRAHT